MHVVPTKKGIVLAFGQLECLRNASGIMEQNVLELSRFIQCHEMEYHNADYCLECNPNISKTEAQRYYDAGVKMGLKGFCYFFSVTSVFMLYNCQINMKLFVHRYHTVF